MLIIDGAQGEGGGQILRTSLSLSLITRQPVRIVNIRAGRSKPGLMRQHLTAVQAAREIGDAEVTGATPASQELTFVPRTLKAGDYRFAIGTAGSTMLIFQTLLPALLAAGGRSTLVLEGGTHNPHAPPFDFVEAAFIPLLRQIGHRIEATLERPGFYPAGGGLCRFTIEPTQRPLPLELLHRGAIEQKIARARVAALPGSIGKREIDRVRELTGWDESSLAIRQESRAHGPGNVVTLIIRSEAVTEVFTGFGEQGVRAETVAERAVMAMREYLATDAPVGEHLADQLLLPLTIARGGIFRTVRPTRHTLTNIDVIGKFLPRKIQVKSETQDVCRVEIESNAVASLAAADAPNAAGRWNAGVSE